MLQNRYQHRPVLSFATFFRSENFFNQKVAKEEGKRAYQRNEATAKIKQ